MEHANNIVIKPALLELFQRGLEQFRVILFSAPCGFGKTATASALLAQHQVCVYHAADKDSLTMPPSADCDTVLIDDFHMVKDEGEQQKICDWIRTNYDKRFVFLSRGILPGWLVPFQFTGALLVIDAPMLLFDRATTGQYLEKCGITVAPTELNAIQNITTGYPLATALLCRHLELGEAFCEAVADQVRCEMFLHYETSVYRQFELPMRQLLISLAPFAQFNLELAQMVSGDSCVGELLGFLQRDTTMMVPDGQDTYHFWPAFRKFLLWELSQEYSTVEQNAVYSRAGLYYELHHEYARALDCYSKCGDNHKVSELLMKNAEQHPGVGHYYDMENYYYAIPEKDVLRSISLMCGMSMLTALNLDYEASEHWYTQLQNYTARLRKGDAAYKDAQGKLAYLDIALPQRGSKGLLELISSVFRVLSNKELKIPSFSVTSTLPSVMNGGKDFCEWSKRDDMLYATMRKPVELVLGRDGVGLADCAICESKFEKGEDIAGRLLTLVSRLSEIHRKGTPDIEFAVMGLLVRLQTSQGQADAALSTLNDLRDSFVDTGQVRFLPNIDAMRCRLWLRLEMTDEVEQWHREHAPASGPRLRALWRYQYMTLAMVQIFQENYDAALLVLAPLLPYCEHCGRIMDGLHLRLLMAICFYRQKNERWKSELSAALSTAYKYHFIQPVAQYGAALLPMLYDCGWQTDDTYRNQLVLETRRQAVNYPDFLRPTPQLTEPLSPTEKQVLRLICYNRSNQEIADMLGVKLATVKTHVIHILQKLGVKRRSEAKEVAETLHLI